MNPTFIHFSLDHKEDSDGNWSRFWVQMLLRVLTPGSDAPPRHTGPSSWKDFVKLPASMKKRIREV